MGSSNCPVLRSVTQRRRWGGTLLLLLAGLLSVPWQIPALSQAPQNTATETLLSQGSNALQHGDLSTAQQAFQHVITIAPERAEGYYGLGLVQLKSGTLGPAMQSLQKAVDLNPKLVGARVFLGIAQAQHGDSDAALGSLHAALDLQPDNVEALTWLGIISLGNDRPDQAADAFDRASVLQPKDPQLLYYKARAHAQLTQAALKQLYALDPDSALVHRALAESLADSGQPEQAIAEYGKALARQPQSADILEAMGEQQQKLTRFDDATRTYQQELALNPNSAIAMYNLGKIDVEHGQPKPGIDLLRKAVAAHAAPAPADYYLGLGLVEVGETEEARHWLEQCLANQPSAFIEESALFQLTRVYQRLGRKEDADRVLARLKQMKGAAAAPEDGGPLSTSTATGSATHATGAPRQP